MSDRELLERIEHLEASARKLRRTVACTATILAIVLGFVALMPASALAQRKRGVVVQAERFEVLDHRGNVRAVLADFAPNGAGQPGVYLYDPEGRVLVGLGTQGGPGGYGLQIYGGRVNKRTQEIEPVLLGALGPVGNTSDVSLNLFDEDHVAHTEITNNELLISDDELGSFKAGVYGDGPAALIFSARGTPTWQAGH